MTTIEYLPLQEDTSDVDEFYCHAYARTSEGAVSDIAVCGLPQSRDKHRQMHAENGQKMRSMTAEDTACSKCAAPICPTCLATARWAMGWE